MTEIYLKSAGSLGTACPASGMGNAPLPVIVRGAPLEFTLKPVGFTFPACASWTFIFNDRFDGSTAKVIASSVTQSASGIAVDVTETNTTEGAAWIGAKPAAPIHGELTGFDASGAVAFRVQILNWPYRNELGSGTPTPFPLSSIDRNPAMEFTVADATWGRCVYLDATTPVLTLADHLRNAARARLRIESANVAIVGNVVLVPSVAGVDRAPVVCASGAWALLELGGASGAFTLRRDVANALDTLKDGEPVTAIVTVLEVIYHEG